MLRAILALFWILSGLVTLGNDAAGRAFLFDLPRAWADPVLLVTGGWSLLLGAALLNRAFLPVAVRLQIATLIVQTAALTLLIPELWLDPTMPLAKGVVVAVASLPLVRPGALDCEPELPFLQRSLVQVRQADPEEPYRARQRHQAAQQGQGDGLDQIALVDVVRE